MAEQLGDEARLVSFRELSRQAAEETMADPAVKRFAQEQAARTIARIGLAHQAITHELNDPLRDEPESTFET
ncbi:MAG: hypothetical protein ABSB12_00125 [Candidatus Saccharimonadales bacterium]|jgi:hypothetical protein